MHSFPSEGTLLRIRGGERGSRPLRGVVRVHGAKNAALPLLISSLLTSEPCRYRAVPKLRDLHTTLQLLSHLGTQITPEEEGTWVLQTPTLHTWEAPYEWVRQMRASFWVLGPLLARFGKAKVSLPGGCAIGARPVDFHLAGLKKMGAQIELSEGYVQASVGRLQGARIGFDFPSVGATANLMMAATLAQGETLLENCAREPEMLELAKVLKTMGAQIEGEGTETLRIQGVSELRGCDHWIEGDRLEAGTLLLAALGTGGHIRCEGIAPARLETVLVQMEEVGATLQRGGDWIELLSSSRELRPVSVTTLPFPGFPTDLQAQWMALMTQAEGSSVLTETIFENRFMHVPEFCRLGAKITLRGNAAWVEGRTALQGATVMASDIRASAGLVLAGLFASGETWIDRLYHLDRGYESLEAQLKTLGADIERVSLPGAL